MAQNHESITPSKVQPFFDTVIIPAVLLDVYPSTNTCDIHTDEDAYWGRLDGVPIFYHCPHTSMVSEGYKAFVNAMDKAGGEEVEVLFYVPDGRWKRPCNEAMRDLVPRFVRANTKNGSYEDSSAALKLKINCFNIGSFLFLFDSGISGTIYKNPEGEEIGSFDNLKSPMSTDYFNVYSDFFGGGWEAGDSYMFSIGLETVEETGTAKPPDYKSLPDIDSTAVVGFVEGLHPCERIDLLDIKIGGQHLVWDITNSKPIDRFLGNDVEGFCDNDLFDSQFNERTDWDSIPILLEFNPPIGSGYFVGDIDFAPTFGISGRAEFNREDLKNQDVTWSRTFGCGSGFLNEARWVPIIDPNYSIAYDENGKMTVKDYTVLGFGTCSWAGAVGYPTVKPDLLGIAEYLGGYFKFEKDCLVENDHVWPDQLNFPEKTEETEFYSVSRIEQDIELFQPWAISNNSCPPYYYAQYDPLPIEEGERTDAVFELDIVNTAMLGLSDYGYGISKGGDFGSKVIKNIIEDDQDTFVRTKMSLSVRDSNNEKSLYHSLQGCDTSNPYEFSGEETKEQAYTFFSHWGEMATYNPIAEGEMAPIVDPDTGANVWKNGHRRILGSWIDGEWIIKDANLKFFGVVDTDLHVQVFAHQRVTDELHIAVHAGVEQRPEDDEETDYTKIHPNDDEKIPRNNDFESAIKTLIENYYTETYGELFRPPTTEFEPAKGIDHEWEFEVKRGIAM